MNVSLLQFLFSEEHLANSSPDISVITFLLFAIFVHKAIRLSTCKRSVTNNQSLHKRSYRHGRMQMYTHTHIYGHIEMHLSLKCFFYFIFSGYEAHSERVKSHLLRLVCEKDRDRASGASPTLAQQPAGTSLGHELPLLTSTTQPLLTANSGNEPRLNQDLFNTMAMRPGRTWSFCFRTLFPVTSVRWQGMVKWSF